MGFRPQQPKIEDKQKTCMIKRGILNIKIAGKIKKPRKTQKQGWLVQSTLDQYVANKVGNPKKNRSKLNSIVDSTQTTLDRFISRIKVSESWVSDFAIYLGLLICSNKIIITRMTEENGLLGFLQKKSLFQSDHAKKSKKRQTSRANNDSPTSRNNSNDIVEKPLSLARNQ